MNSGKVKIKENIGINQEIYFLNPSFEVYEKYTVNNHIIVRKLGFFVNKHFIPNKDFKENTLKRRANFYGVELVALTEKWLPGLDIRNLESAKYDETKERYEVTNLVSGPFHDVLKILEKSLNFTTKLYKR